MAHIHIGEDYLWLFHLQLTSGGPATGKSPTVEISQAGGAFGALTGAPAVSELATASGVYKVLIDGSDISDVSIAIKATAAGSAQLVDIFDIDEAERIAHLALSGLLKYTVTTGVLQIYEEDGVTVLQTYTPSEVDGVISWTPT